ncbi:MAG: hypothetical protein Q9228_002633 [Teloschistes exilis]
MAPISSKRSLIRSRALKARSTASNPIRHTHAKSGGAFGASKKDKRTIKHSALISRIEKSKLHKPKKRRRPSKKLVVSLESLADALPEAPSREEAAATEASAEKIRHRSLKSQPGAMKKKEKIIRLEKDRFNQNMAQLTAMTAIYPSAVEEDDASHAMTADNGGQIAHRWAALKTFIQQNVQQRPSAVQASTLHPNDQ